MIHPSLSDLPSWVPDLSNSGRTPSSLPWTNVHGLRTFQTRSNKRCGAGLQFVKYESPTDNNPRKIWVKAVLLDKIRMGMHIHEWEDSVGCPRQGYIKIITQSCRDIFDRYVRCGAEAAWPVEEDPEEAFARTMFADGSGLSFYAAFGGPEYDGSTVSDGSAPINTDRFLALWKDYNTKFERLGQSIESETFSADLASHTVDMLNQVDLYNRCLCEALEGHMFFFTRRKFIGLAPMVARPEDQITLIDSLATTYLLRHCRTSDGQEGYMLLGPCYVQGVMYGETQPESGHRLAQEGEYIPLI